MQIPRGAVTVFGLGGTIAMTPASAGGVTPALSAQALLNSVPGLASAAIPVHAIDFRRTASASLTFADIAALASEIATYPEAAGFVITQGTDTIEETSYLLDLLHRGPQPAVVTGAMRSASQPGADGPANLLAAIRVAADPAARDRGVLVVMNDEIHPAREVRKTHTTSPAAFRSPNTGIAGTVTEGRVRFTSTAQRRLTIPVPAAEPLRQARVALLTMTFDDDGALLHAVRGNADGVVLAGVGGGHVPRSLIQLASELAAEIPVVLATRVPAGPALRSTYGFPGSEIDLLARDLIPAGWLDPFKARILLRALLANGASRDTITATFAAATE